MDSRVGNSTFDADELRLLAGLLRMPGPDALAVIEELADSNPWLAAPLRELDSLPLDQWQAEYTRMFINGYPAAACPPFESVYRQGQMHGMASWELETFYRALGLHCDETPADFLGVMLECAAYLLERQEPWAGQRWKELRDDHLALWVPRFCRDLIVHSRLELYRQVGRRLAGIFDRA